ncbi:MAG: hypothetical protein ACREML_06415, partial [Vulcanimicrobiaceae bacterium]
YTSMSCYNVTNIYAPGGSDTFYALTYDSQQRLLSLSPGIPGTSIYGATPTPYTIPYAGAIDIQTYGIPNTVSVVSPTACVSGFGTQFFVTDADGDIMSGALAYPVTVNASNGFTIAYAGVSVGSSYTFYSAPDPDSWEFASPGNLSGETSTITSSTSRGNLGVTLPNLYAVDHTALVASAAGLYGIGLVNGGSASYACGPLALATYSNETPVSFTNPVAMSSDGFSSVVVLDDAAANPTVDVLLANDLWLNPASVPVVQTTLLSTGGVDVAATANLQAYILNSDGSIQRVDYTNAVNFPFEQGNTNDGAIATGLTTPAGSSIGAFGAAIVDYVFASSYGSPFIYEVDNANGTPSFTASSISGASIPNVSATFSPTAVTTAVAADSLYLYANFRAWDPGQSPGSQTVAVSCALTSGVPCINTTLYANSFSGNFGGAGTEAVDVITPALFFSDGPHLTGVYEQSNVGSFTEVAGFSATPNRIVTSPDGLFVGVQLGTMIYFAPVSTETPVGSQTGTVAAIWTYPFF